MSKTGCLDKAIEIVKEYAKNTNSTQGSIDVVLEEVYRKLVELSEDIKN